MAQTPGGLEVPAGTDAFDPQGDMVQLANSMRSRLIYPVANAAARDALVAALSWAPSADEPLKVDRADTGTIERNAGAGWDDGGWSAYSPAWSNFVPGSSTVTARFRRIGKTVHVVVNVALNTGFAMNANLVEVGLPVPRSSSWPAGVVVGVASITDSGTGYYGPHLVRLGGSSVVLHDVYAGRLPWANGDAFTATLTYEAA